MSSDKTLPSRHSSGQKQRSISPYFRSNRRFSDPHVEFTSTLKFWQELADARSSISKGKKRNSNRPSFLEQDAHIFAERFNTSLSMFKNSLGQLELTRSMSRSAQPSLCERSYPSKISISDIKSSFENHTHLSVDPQDVCRGRPKVTNSLVIQDSDNSCRPRSDFNRCISPEKRSRNSVYIIPDDEDEDDLGNLHSLKVKVSEEALLAVLPNLESPKEVISENDQLSEGDSEMILTAIRQTIAQINSPGLSDKEIQKVNEDAFKLAGQSPENTSYPIKFQSSSDSPGKVLRERRSTAEIDKREREAIRSAILAEILHTEKEYVKHLDILIQKFAWPLKTNPNYGLSPQQAAVIFSNIEIIIVFHKQFVKELMNAEKKVGDVFLKYADFLKMYAEYLRNYDHALRVLGLLKTNKKFQSFLKVCREDPDCPLSLTSYLIMPVQRVPRYELLLRELWKRTCTSHEEWTSLDLAYRKVQKVTEHINEMKRKVESASKLFEIQNKIQGKISAPLIDPGRHLIREGNFEVIRESVIRGHYLRKYIIFLFNDVVLITNDKFDFKLMGSLRQLILSPWEIVRGVPRYGFILETRQTKIKFLCTNVDERDEWITLLESTKNELLHLENDVSLRKERHSQTRRLQQSMDMTALYPSIRSSEATNMSTQFSFSSNATEVEN